MSARLWRGRKTRGPSWAASWPGLAAVGYGLLMQAEKNIDMFVPPGSDFRESLEVWKTGKTSSQITDTHGAVMASFLMTHNIQVSFFAFALGVLGGLLSAVLLFYNG